MNGEVGPLTGFEMDDQFISSQNGNKQPASSSQLKTNHKPAIVLFVSCAFDKSQEQFVFVQISPCPKICLFLRKEDRHT
jgi:hypothetical protein